MGIPVVERQRIIPSSPHARRYCVTTHQDAADSPLAGGSPKIRRGRPGNALLGLAYTLFILGLICVGCFAIRLGPNRILPARTASQGQQTLAKGAESIPQEQAKDLLDSKYDLKSDAAQASHFQGSLGERTEVGPNWDKASQMFNTLANVPLQGQRIKLPTDVVVALYTQQAGERAVEAYRELRQGIRTLVVTDRPAGVNMSSTRLTAPANERWDWFPDDVPLRSVDPGSTRQALSPLLAYREFGNSFKWLFMGPADTIFFPEAAANVVADLDPDMPYVLTDHLWWSGSGTKHPNPLSPRCAPCGFEGNLSLAPVAIPRGCPCTPSLLCETTPELAGLQAYGHSCALPRPPMRTYSLHGDAGVLMSIGTFQKLDWGSIETCIKGMYGSAGDFFLTACLWQAGVAVTDPNPLYHPDRLTMFDPNPPPTLDKSDMPSKVDRVLGNLLRALAGVCDGLCQLEVKNTVSLHLRSDALAEDTDALLAAGRLISHLFSQVVGRPRAFPTPWLGLSPTIDHVWGLPPSLVARVSDAISAIRDAQVHCQEENREDPASVITFRDDPVKAFRTRAEVGVAQAVARDLLDSVAASVRQSLAPAPAPEAHPSLHWRFPSLLLSWHTAAHQQAAPRPPPSALCPQDRLALRGGKQDAVGGCGAPPSTSGNGHGGRIPVQEVVKSAVGSMRAQGPTLKPEDFVVAIATHEKRESMLRATTLSRKGVRTFLATDYGPPNDTALLSLGTWGTYPDDKPPRSLLNGDSRAALVPFMAFRELGDSFKWLFYGDDDTLFFLDSAIRLVQDFDHNMPYFLIDNMWYTTHMANFAYHPHKLAPACVPCGYKGDTSGLPFPYPAACPCTPAAMCAADTTGALNKPPAPCGFPHLPARTYAMHGGAGALISVGLLRAVGWDAIEECVLTSFSSGGDGFITSCLWQLGYGLTNPDPLWHPRNMTMFDPSPSGLVPDEDILDKAAYTLAGLLLAAAGRCRGLCALERDHIVTLHLRGRWLGSEEAPFDVLRLFSTLHANITGRGGSTGLDAPLSSSALDGTLWADSTYVGGAIDKPGTKTALDMSAAARRASKADALASAAVESLRGMMVKECSTKGSSNTTRLDGEARQEALFGAARSVAKALLEAVVANSRKT